MQVLNSILFFIVIVLLAVSLAKFIKIQKSFEEFNKHLDNLIANFKELQQCLIEFEDDINKNNNIISGLVSPINTIAKFGTDITDIKETVYKNQTALTVAKNMVEETRNYIKASKPSKNSKTNKISSKQKSANSEALKDSQTANSSNK